MKLLYYNAYLLPMFDYCSTVWGKNNKMYINKILILQKRAAKLILNKPIRTTTDVLFKQLIWLTFTDRCKYHTALLVYKTLNHMAPSYMSDIITASTNNSYSLRSLLRNDFVLKHKTKTKYINYSFNYYCMTVWNKIPIEIRNAANIKSFKCFTRNICVSVEYDIIDMP